MVSRRDFFRSAGAVTAAVSAASVSKVAMAALPAPVLQTKPDTMAPLLPVPGRPYNPVVTLNGAVAVSKARGAAEALAMVEPLAAKLGSYFYFHGARGAFLKKLGRSEEARVAFDRAIALAGNAAEAAHIRQHIDNMQRDAIESAE